MPSPRCLFLSTTSSLSLRSCCRPNFPSGLPAIHSVAAHGSQTARQISASASSPSSVFQPGNGQFVRTLERTTLTELGKDVDLWNTGRFHASVYPDLPLANTLLEVILRQIKGTAQEERKDGGPTASTSSPRPSPAPLATVPEGPLRKGSVPAHWLHPQLVEPNSGPVIKTVAAQTRSREFLRGALQLAAGVDSQGDPRGDVQRADGLLILGGGHPVRSVANGSLRGLFVSAVDLLQMASEMKRSGELPRDLMLWCVANPMTEPSAALLEAKVAAGAQVVLTQPPLLWDRWDTWQDDLERRRLHRSAKLVAGLPIVASARNLGFWFDLCGAAKLPGAREVVEQYAAKEASLDKDAFQMYRREWSLEMVRILQHEYGGTVEGVHVMATTPRSRRDTLDLVRGGLL